MGCLVVISWFVWLIYSVTIIVCMFVGHTLAIGSPFAVWGVWLVCNVMFHFLTVALSD